MVGFNQATVQDEDHDVNQHGVPCFVYDLDVTIPCDLEDDFNWDQVPGGVDAADLRTSMVNPIDINLGPPN